MNNIYACIPEATRSMYGSTQEEQIENFLKAHPEYAMKVAKYDINDEQSILDYMAVTLAERVGIPNMALKGSYVLNKRIKNCRKTYDIDLSIERKELYEDIKLVLKDIGDEFVAAGIASDYVIKEDITETSSGGIKFSGCKTNRPLGVDVGLRTLGFGVTSLHIVDTDVNVFSIERSLSDKLSVLCSRKRFRRVKDIYDIYVLISTYDVDYALLKECMSYRDVSWDLYPDDENVLVQLKRAYDMLEIGFSSAQKPAFAVVTQKLRKFCEPMLNENFIVSRWSCREERWL